MYGEWLREQFDKGAIPEPTYDPDLAILLSQLRENSINLFGPEATEVIEPVPMTDIRRAIKESLPGLIASIEGDEHNVILEPDVCGNISINFLLFFEKTRYEGTYRSNNHQ
jgi:aminoglycoside 9-adenylyltransferase